MEPVRVRLNLDDPDVFKSFSSDMNSFRSDIDAFSGSISLDAKSLLAIVSLGKPEFSVAIVSADPDEIRRFREVIRKYEI